MTSHLTRFAEIKTKYKYDFLVLTMIFIAAAIASVSNYYDLFSTLLGRELLFTGVIIFSLFLFIVWLPSYLVPKITSALLLIVLVLTLIISEILISTVSHQFTLELLFLLVSYIYCVHRYRKLSRKLQKFIPTETAMLSYAIYKNYELNIITMVLNIVALFAIFINKLSLISVIFGAISIIIILLSAYRRMFILHLDCSRNYIFIIEICSIVAAYLLLIFLLSTSAGGKYYFLLIAVLFPHWLNTIRIWREFSTILFH